MRLFLPLREETSCCLNNNMLRYKCVILKNTSAGCVDGVAYVMWERIVSIRNLESVDLL